MTAPRPLRGSGPSGRAMRCSPAYGPGVAPGRVGAETEAAVVGGVAEHEGRGPASLPRASQRGAHERRADALALTVRQHRQESEGERALRSFESAEQDVADDNSIIALRDQGHDR